MVVEVVVLPHSVPFAHHWRATVVLWTVIAFFMAIRTRVEGKTTVGKRLTSSNPPIFLFWLPVRDKPHRFGEPEDYPHSDLTMPTKSPCPDEGFAHRWERKHVTLMGSLGTSRSMLSLNTHSNDAHPDTPGTGSVLQCTRALRSTPPRIRDASLPPRPIAHPRRQTTSTRENGLRMIRQTTSAMEDMLRAIH